MAKILMCEPFELYNLLNQCNRVSRLAEINYLCLIDAREIQDYDTSHVITAKSVRMDLKGTVILPEAVEFDTMQHVVVYDSKTSCLEKKGRAITCARALAKLSLNPVYIVRGGFERFSALYTFLRTEKIIYTIMELENLKTYPVEIIEGVLYMGDQKQVKDDTILSDLKITAIVNVSQSDSLKPVNKNQVILNIPVDDSVSSDLYSSFEKICSFIDLHINLELRVLVVSRQGKSRCSAVTIAFLMHNLTQTVEDAWKYVLKCKPSMRPNTGFLQQLSDWEIHVMGKQVTDISEPHF